MYVHLGGPQLVGVEQEVQLEEAAGRMVNLSCEAQGHPLPSISWNIIGSQVSSLHCNTAQTSQRSALDAVHHAVEASLFCSDAPVTVDM